MALDAIKENERSVNDRSHTLPRHTLPDLARTNQARPVPYTLSVSDLLSLPQLYAVRNG